MGKGRVPPSARNIASHSGWAMMLGTYLSFLRMLGTISSFIPLRKSFSRLPATGVSVGLLTTMTGWLPPKVVACGAADTAVCDALVPVGRFKSDWIIA